MEARVTTEAIILLIAALIPLGTLAIGVTVIREMRELERTLDDLIELRTVER